MNTFHQIANFISDKTTEIEAGFDLGDLTVKYGVHSFRYGSSDYLEELFDSLDLTAQTVFYDLGSGYGKVILYGACQYPKVQFKGIEIIEERNKVCNELIDQLNLTNIQTYCTDLFEMDCSDGDIFYIFNPLHESLYERLIQKLAVIAKNKNITVIAESKCDVFDRVSWLSNYKTLDTNIDVRKKVKFYRSEF